MPETALAFLLFYLLGLIMALAVRPVFGLYTYVGVFYLHPPSRWWGDALPDLRWSLLAAAITFVSIHLHQKSDTSRPPWHSSTTARVLILYAFWMWVQLLWVDAPLQMEGAVLFTKYVMLFYLMYSIIDDAEGVSAFCWVQVIGCAYLGLLAYFAPPGGRLEGVGGPGIDNSNSLGMHLSSMLMFAAFLLLGSKGYRRVALLLMLPFIVNGIIQTGTRGAFVGLLLAGLLSLYLKPKSLRRGYYFCAGLAVVGFLFLANEVFIERMSTLSATFEEEEQWDTSAQSRIAIVQAQVEMFKDYPMGVGHQGTTYLSRQYLDEQWLTRDGWRSSHNTIMSVLVDQGVPGIVLFGILGLSVARQLREMKRLDKSGISQDLGLLRVMVGTALVSAAGAGMFADFLKAEVQIWCLVLLVIIGELSRRELKKTSELPAEASEASSPSDIPRLPVSR